MAFNLQDYQEVKDRLPKFWADFPDGRVITTVLDRPAGEWMLRADLFTDRDDTNPAATGHAHEFVSAKGVNSTSALENCETSAIGRALANLGYATSKERPSREEMAAAQAAADDLAARRGAVADRIAGMSEDGKAAAKAEWLEVGLPGPSQLLVHQLPAAEAIVAG
jgi:hypothetical protein